MTQKEKTKFRSQSTWKNFRKKLKEERRVDELTHKPLRSSWNLHHLCLDDTRYTDLSDESMFACLNKTQHKMVHDAYRYACKDPEYLERFVNLVQRMCEINA